MRIIGVLLTILGIAGLVLVAILPVIGLGTIIGAVTAILTGICFIRYASCPLK